MNKTFNQNCAIADLQNSIGIERIIRSANPCDKNPSICLYKMKILQIISFRIFSSWHS